MVFIGTHGNLCTIGTLYLCTKCHRLYLWQYQQKCIHNVSWNPGKRNAGRGVPKFLWTSSSSATSKTVLIDFLFVENSFKIFLEASRSRSTTTTASDSIVGDGPFGPVPFIVKSTFLKPYLRLLSHDNMNLSSYPFFYLLYLPLLCSIRAPSLFCLKTRSH